MCGRYVISDEEDNIEIRKLFRKLTENLWARLKGKRCARGKFSYQYSSCFTSRFFPEWLPAVPLKWGFPRFGGPGVVINARQKPLG